MATNRSFLPKPSGSTLPKEAPRCGWFDGNNDVETRPVGLKALNEMGIYDMSGNVWEWCLVTMDWNIYEQRIKNEAPVEDLVNLKSGDYRVLRGGSYWHGAAYCRVANRYNRHPLFHFGNIGFRVMLSPSSGSGAVG